MITWADVEAFASELSTLDNAAQDAILTHVNETLNADQFGGDDSALLRLARIYLAAHFGTLTTRGASGASGPVTSESAGGLSRSYGWLGAGSDPLLDSTSYGMAYRALVRVAPARAWKVL